MENTQGVIGMNDDVASQSDTQATVRETVRETLVKQLDAYGRDAAERTVELAPVCAAAANAVVSGESVDAVLATLKAEYEGGEPETFDDALGYIIYRGVAEIKRQQLAADAAKAKAHLASQQKLYKAMLAMNPQLVNDFGFVKKMMSELGLTK